MASTVTGTELRAIRLKLGLTPAQFGRALGYAGKCDITIWHMEAGKKTITLMAARLAWMYARYRIPRDWLKPQ